MADFLDYYEAELRKRRGARPASSGAPKKEEYASFAAPKKSVIEEVLSPTNPIGWTLDMISRPLYGVQGKLSAQIDDTKAATGKLTGVRREGDKITVGTPDPVGGAIDTVMSVLGLTGNQAEATVKGITSNDRSAKITTADNIEKVADETQNLNPEYEDVQDNVNPWVKGIGGFIGDVALDPLNALPATAIAKGVGALGKLGKGAATGVRDAVKAPLPEAAPVAAVKETVPARITPEEVAAENVNAFEGFTEPEFMRKPEPVAPVRSTDEIAPATAQVQELPEPLITPHAGPKVDKAAEAVVEAAMPTPVSLASAIKNSPKIPGMKAEIKQIFDELNAAPSTPVKIDDWAKTATETAYVSLPGTAVAKAYTPAQLRSIYLTELTKSAGGRLPASPIHRKVAEDAMSARGKAARNLYRGMYDEATTARSSAVTDSLEAFARRLQNGEKVMRATLGDGLVDQLSGITSPKSMTNTLTVLNRILSGAVDVERLSQQGGSKAKLIENLRAFLPDAVEKTPGTANVQGEAPALAAQLSATSEAFRQTVRQEMLPGTPEFDAKYLPASGKNPLRFTSEDVDDRLARWWRKGNQQFQYTLFGKLHDQVIKDKVVEVTGQQLDELIGKPNAAALRVAIDTTGDEITRAMEVFGIPMHIGTAEDLVPIAFPQLYKLANDALAAQFGDDAALLALYNGGSRVAFTNLTEAVHRMLTGGDMEAVLAALRQPVKGSNNITKAGGKGWYAPVKNLSPKMEETAELLGGKWVKGGKQGYQLVLDGEKLPAMLADALWAARDDIAEIVGRNREEWAARGISEAQDISGRVLANLRRLADDPSKAAQKEAALRIHNLSKDVGDEGARIAATGEGTIGADVVTHAAVGETTSRQAEALVTHEEDIRAGLDLAEAASKTTDKQMSAVEQADPRDFTPSEVTQLLNDAFEEASERAVGDVDVPVEKFDIGARAAMDVWDTRDHILGAPGTNLQRRFDADFGAKTLNPDARAAGSTASRFVTNGVLEPMRVLAKTYSAETLSNALRAVQQGTRVPEGELAEAVAGIETVVSRLFDLTPASATKPSALGNVFMDNATNIEHVNEMLRWAWANKGGQPLEFDLPGARTEAFKLNGNKKPSKAQVADQLRNQWRTWNFGDDPANSIVAIGQAAARVVEHQAIVTNFVRTGTKNGWTVKVPKGAKPPAGYVKIVDTTGGIISKMLPKDVVVSKEIAKELKVLNWLMTEPRQLSGELGEFARGTIVPMTNSWKRLMTVMRPGHHIRNGIGNLSIQYVSRGTRDMEKAWRHTLKLMAVRNEHEGMDALAALKGMGDESVPTGGDVLVSGKFGEITQQEIWDRLNREGMLPTYSSAEGLLDAEVAQGGIIARAAKKVSLEDTKIGRVAGGVSQGLDHYQRAHHFMQILMQESSKRGGKWSPRSKEELYRLAAREVKRSHPDASMLSAFENKTMKLLIPFYTWLRGILPFAIESAIQHPGRISNFNKASYNLAIGMGINPDSLGDPFPEDQLFPSFIRESMFGPQFQLGESYLRVNPGIAHADLAATFADPVRGVLGMANPLFRVPAELASGGSWSTGAPIRDWSDYLDSALPGVNYAANVSGVSPTGSVESLLTGQGLDTQAQVEAGNKGDFDKGLSVANWLLGIGLQNLSRPNYENFAEIEKRNAASKEK